MDRKTVITYGSFDLFHEGHYNLLRRAKALGDYLIVGVTTEQFDLRRGKMNVVDSLLTRIDNVRRTGFADEIIIEDHDGQKVEDIQKYHVDVFTVGSDWKGRFEYLRPFCDVVYLERTKDVSSTMLREHRFSILRIGVIGSGRIAAAFAEEAKLVSGVTLAGVYNPNHASAQAFAQRYDLRFGTDDLSALLDAVDAVYIASPHLTHGDYIDIALRHGKHVLCEKPLALSAETAARAYALARERNLVLMEGIKTAYAPGFVKMAAMAKSGHIGVVRDVNACFTSLTIGTFRPFDASRFDGSMTELGSYPLFAIFRLLGTDYTDLRFRSFRDSRGVDQYTEISLTFPHAVATARIGLGVKSEGALTVAGTEGYLRVDAPWWKPQSFSLCYEDPERDERFYEKYLGAGLRYEISSFLDLTRSEDRRNAKLSEQESIAIAGVMERYLRGENLTILRIPE